MKPALIFPLLALSLVPACAKAANAPPKPLPKAAPVSVLPPSFYDAPPFSPNQRPFERLLAKNQYARDLHYRFNKILRGDPHRRQIALTFDDGPHPVYTLRLLDVLRRTHTPATFFVVGEQVQKNPGLVRLEVAEGNEVGDHTFDHVNLTVVPPELVAYEVSACDRAITKATGAPVRFFRPPAASTTAKCCGRWPGRGTSQRCGPTTPVISCSRPPKSSCSARCRIWRTGRSFCSTTAFRRRLTLCPASSRQRIGKATNS